MEKSILIRKDEIVLSWGGYSLVDSGEGRKLENFSGIMLDRPDPQAIWEKRQKELWFSSHAQFLWAEKGERWKINKNLNDKWIFNWKSIKAELSIGGFKHVGVFPEHSLQWEELFKIGQKNKNLKALNLFGYTGMASLACSLAGMSVTHVDSSKQTINALKRNMKLSGIKEDNIKIICEDATKFLKRLSRRGERFDIVLMDPPAFGRGPKGEVWKIEKDLSSLVSVLKTVLSNNPKMVLLNGYASGFSSRTFAQILDEHFPKGKVYFGEISIKEKNTGRLLTTGIYSKWAPD